MVATADDEQLTLRLGGDGRINVTTRLMNGMAEADVLSGQGEVSEPRMTFIDGQTAYNECGRSGWDRQNLSQSEDWLSYTPVGQQLEAVNQPNVDWRGTETVDGQNAAVIVGYPTNEQLEAVPSVGGTRLTESVESASVESASVETASVENVTVTVWLDAETECRFKATRDVTAREDGNTATVNAAVRFGGFNEPTPVTLPEIDDEVLWEGGCPS